MTLFELKFVRYARRRMFFTVWPPNASRQKLSASQYMREIYDLLATSWTCESTCESVWPPVASPYAFQVLVLQTWVDLRVESHLRARGQDNGGTARIFFTHRATDSQSRLCFSLWFKISVFPPQETFVERTVYRALRYSLNPSPLPLPASRLPTFHPLKKRQFCVIRS